MRVGRSGAGEAGPGGRRQHGGRGGLEAWARADVRTAKRKKIQSYSQY